MYIVIAASMRSGPVIKHPSSEADHIQGPIDLQMMEGYFP